jgi:Ca-activated chloride channel homolog
MKFIRALFVVCLICAVAGFAFSQEKSKEKDKKAEKKIEQKPVEIKANVAVLDTAGNFANDVKLEDLKIFEDGVEQKITYFVKKEPILNLGLVVDNTGSLRTQFEKVLGINLTLISNLRQNDEAIVVRFVDSTKISVEQEWTSDKLLLKKAIENMDLEGGQSAIIDALYLSGQRLLEREKKDKQKRYAMVLVTDAEERRSFYKLEEMFSLIEKTDIQIFVIALTKELSDKKNKFTNTKNAKTNAENLAKTLALRTGGTAHILSEEYSDEDLIGVLKIIITELRSQYIIGYTSTNQNRDGLPRKLTVQVADGTNSTKRQGFIRESFVVPKD